MKKPTSKGPEVRAAQEAYDKGKNGAVTRTAGIHPAAKPEAAKKPPVVSLPATGIPGESHAWQSGLLFFGIIGVLVVALAWGGWEFWSRVHGG